MNKTQALKELKAAEIDHGETSCKTLEHRRKAGG